MPSTEADHQEGFLHIAVGVVTDAAGRILISERKADCAYAGQWEFPGGKVERNESVEQALARELKEELGLVVEQLRPLIRIRYQYPDRRVLLDTWQVTRWSGRPESREGQRFAWVGPESMAEYPMLAANRPIVMAAVLPAHYLITPDMSGPEREFLTILEARLGQGVRLVRLRQPGMAATAYRLLAEKVSRLCADNGAELMVDDLQCAQALSAGLHLNSRNLMTAVRRPLGDGRLLAASCHDMAELRQAEALGCDFAVLGTVKATATHPAVIPIGWECFASLADTCNLPVYALGGMTVPDTQKAWASGGQGIASIRGLWKTA